MIPDPTDAASSEAMDSRLTRTKPRRKDAPWVQALGSHGLGECMRCGRRLGITLPEDARVVVAAMMAFVKVHRRCLPRFKCPVCQRVSWNRNDLEQGYCDSCKDFTDPAKAQWERSLVDA